MIQISRSLARQLRAVFRRLAGRSAPIHPVLSLHAGKDGIRIRLNADIAAEFHQAGSYAEEVLTLPLAALANFEGRTDALVELETARSGVTLARWADSGVPQVKGYDSQELDSLAKFPDSPETMTPIEPGFMMALEDASHSASSASRYATDHIQLRGHTGQVIATDGHELLLQSGFHFPFSEDVLILNTPVFGCRELDPDSGVRIGRTATHVTIQIGSWTLHLPINPDGRFPQAEQIVPSPSAALIHWRIDAADAAFLAKTLPKLPGGGDEDSAVTVDLNGQAAIRAKAEGEGPVTELILARSQLTGPPARFRIDRLLLARAVHLGFREVALVNGDSPILCKDERRQFVVMPLGKDSALPPSKNALRIASTQDASLSKPPQHERRSTTVEESPVPTATSGDGLTNGDGAPHPPESNGQGKTPGGGINAVIAEVEELKNVLRDAYGRTSKLATAIRRQKKQAQAVQATLASLRQLQHVEG